MMSEYRDEGEGNKHVNKHDLFTKAMTAQNVLRLFAACTAETVSRM